MPDRIYTPNEVARLALAKQWTREGSHGREKEED